MFMFESICGDMLTLSTAGRGGVAGCSSGGHLSGGEDGRSVE